MEEKFIILLKKWYKKYLNRIEQIRIICSYTTDSMKVLSFFHIISLKTINRMNKELHIMTQGKLIYGDKNKVFHATGIIEYTDIWRKN